MIERHGVQFENLDAQDGRATLLFPLDNFNFSENGVTSLMGTIAGDILGQGNIGKIVVDDIDLPQSLFTPAILPGPQIGIEGIRSLTALSNRPIFAFTAKPRLGLDPQRFAELCGLAARGGADIVEDDERLIDLGDCPLFKRTEAVLNELERVSDGQVLYSPNLTGRPDRIVQRVEQLLQQFGNKIKMLKVDALPASFSGLMAVRQRLEGRAVAITSYPAMEVLYQLLSRKLILKMARFCGADIIYGGTPALPSGGAGRYNLAHIMDIYDRHRALRGNLPNVKTVLPTVTTSIHPGNIGSLCFLLGEDIGIFVGGAVVGHPRGVEAGAKLVRRAIDEASRENYDIAKWVGDEAKVLDSKGWMAVNPKDFEDPLVLGMSRLFRAL